MGSALCLGNVIRSGAEVRFGMPTIRISCQQHKHQHRITLASCKVQGGPTNSVDSFHVSRGSNQLSDNLPVTFVTCLMQGCAASSTSAFHTVGISTKEVLHEAFVPSLGGFQQVRAAAQLSCLWSSRIDIAQHEVRALLTNSVVTTLAVFQLVPSLDINSTNITFVGLVSSSRLQRVLSRTFQSVLIFHPHISILHQTCKADGSKDIDSKLRFCLTNNTSQFLTLSNLEGPYKDAIDFQKPVKKFASGVGTRANVNPVITLEVVRVRVVDISQSKFQVVLPSCSHA
mmetsp:Transcript_31764/g.51154  ORF Transcript_31764/g.51154 Transcript_31764/m.51154 type:complete len:286 (-) Transcript_31764:842-1699(-)